MTLLNSADAPARIDTRTANTPAEFARQLDRRHDQLVTTIGNLLTMAERAVDRGDAQEARRFLDLARPCEAERDEIRNLRVAGA